MRPNPTASVGVTEGGVGVGVVVGTRVKFGVSVDGGVGVLDGITVKADIAIDMVGDKAVAVPTAPPCSSLYTIATPPTRDARTINRAATSIMYGIRSLVHTYGGNRAAVPNTHGVSLFSVAINSSTRP